MSIRFSEKYEQQENANGFDNAYKATFPRFDIYPRIMTSCQPQPTDSKEEIHTDSKDEETQIDSKEIQLEDDDTLIKKDDLNNLINDKLKLKLQAEWYEEWCEKLYDIRKDDGKSEKLWKDLSTHVNHEEKKRLEHTKKRYVQILERLQTSDMIFNQVRSLHVDCLPGQESVITENSSERLEETINCICLLRNSIFEMMTNNRILTEKLQNTRAEKEEVLTRLSQLAGNRLTYNNSEIADLSDMNRPTNLAEKFNELYDNEWTDAYDHVTATGTSEEESAKELFAVLKKIYNECTMCASSQRNNLYNALQVSNQVQDEGSLPKNRHIVHDNDYIHLQKQITELQKCTSNYCIMQMKKKLAASVKLETPLASVQERLSPFFNKCVELCWYMNIQERPVVLVFDVEKGCSFRTDLYRHYTKSGTKCDYVVWPVMLLHNNGPLLQKGVIQPE